MSVDLSRRDFFKVAGISAGIATGVGTSCAKASVGGGDFAQNHSMLYDTTKCVGCRACQTACREVNDKPIVLDETERFDTPLELSGDTWTLIQLYQEQNGPAWSFVKHQCMHCLEPACVSACPLAALTKSPDGPVVYDTSICFGCRYCMVACPFDVPKYEWESTTPLIQKCDFCVSNGRLANGDGPACAEVCPTDAITWGTRGDMLEDAHAQIEQNPDKYIDHVYGEHEAGGTSALYLSHVPFEDIGLPTLTDESLPAKTKTAMEIGVPSIIVGMGALMTGIHWLTGRREKNGEET